MKTFDVCPFCGHAELEMKQDTPSLFFVQCQNCITQFGFPDHAKLSAMNLWNERHGAKITLMMDKIMELIQSVNSLGSQVEDVKKKLVL